MAKKIRIIFFFVGLCIISHSFIASAQQTTLVSGIVRDSITGETLPYVSVLFENSLIGGMTDDNGYFSIQNNQGYSNLQVTSLGYNTKIIPLKTGTKNEALDVRMAPIAFEIDEVVVRPQRERYSRRDNPAVELVKKVIEYKDQNRIESKAEYQAEMYEKLTLSLDNFNPNLEKNKFLQKFQFITNYLDTSEFNGSPILTVSVRETLSDKYYRKSPRTEKTIIKAKRQEGVDQTLDDSGTLSANLEEIFKSINVFDNNITILLNRFVSPLSSIMATTYYHYYIMDTLDIGGEPCIDLGFVPANSQSYGFTGRMYITMDGNYSLKKLRLDTPRNINLNWVDQFRVEQEFTQIADGTWVVSNENTYVTFYLIKGAQQLYAHQLRSYENYNLEVANRSEVFDLLGPIHTLSGATFQADTFWLSNRHIPLKEKESALNDLLGELRKVPAFNAIIKTAEILISGYIPTSRTKENSKLDFGPMNTTFSTNRVEGFRMRVGGMTTANLNPRWFASGYLAYGVDDRKFKHNIKLTHSFIDKTYHEGESPKNNLSVIHEYDIYTPGQDFLFTSKDNMFVAWKVGEPVTKMQYIEKSVVQYEKEWLNGLTVKGWAKYENNEAAGTLHYEEYLDDGSLKPIEDFTTSELGVQLRFAPGERAYNSRIGKESVANMSKDAPIFKLSHQVGLDNVLSSDYKYHHTEISAEKRIWLSSFGHIDASVKAGKVWNKVPFPLLILPNTNQSITIQPETFTMMRALEFVTDEYASFYLTYYLKGWILNRVPVIKWLKLREVVSFNGVFGRLTDKNNPAIDPTGLYKLPDGTRPLGKTPYLEASVGLENIFKILRVDYYWRLTYLDEPNIKKNGLRIALRFSF
ncbi:DUF5686 and carboxypeptidase regulatory-like domain-containing protein [Parabacteroides sp. OttesenSCG-928-G07]|nr:DUF5686 and carboxypeptidase regulatory-like domain-containing protein [Parabacteroides sp. OttesenSCG-928-G21]MDL2277068.1 DUF5686 and carboxypeptidase regulatory-like domain-containing protein [Parabacteroides sp. OttesenSCG-928-G07]